MTSRPTDPQIKVTYLNHMGDDLTTVNAARVSFNKSSDWEDCSSGLCLSDRDQRLIEYLGRHGHDSPMNHNALSVHVKMPIFVARQLVKHEYLAVNEISRRYVDDPPEFYVPETWRIRPKGNIKQGSGTTKLPAPEFVKGFCPSCGKEITQNTRPQGGGQVRKYCSGSCKYRYTNRNRNPYKACFQNAEARVKREGKREWSLNFDTFDFPEYCPYLGIKLDYSLGKGKIQPDSPSFDRIDPTKDYIPGNVEIISNRANTMKSDASREEQIKMAEHVLLKYRGCVPSKSNTYEGLLESARELYENMIQDGYSPEQARMVLPQSLMTEWHWTGLLSAWAKMVNQRIQPDAQYETRLVAQQVDQIAGNLWPHSWKALRSMSL